jgi:hypothetical protein
MRLALDAAHPSRLPIARGLALPHANRGQPITARHRVCDGLTDESYKLLLILRMGDMPLGKLFRRMARQITLQELRVTLRAALRIYFPVSKYASGRGAGPVVCLLEYRRLLRRGDFR